MESVQHCPKDGCDYSGNGHGLKTHLAISHEDSKYGRVNLSCDTCGKDFTRPQWKVKSDDVFCSRECKDTVNKEERECVVCGTIKIVDSSAYEHKHGWVCSKKCNRQQYRKKLECVVCGSTKSVLAKNIPDCEYRCSKECTKEWVQVETDCSLCGETYIESRYQLQEYDNTYCSKECFYESQRADRCDSRKHQLWAREVKQIQDYTCQKCGDSYDVMCAHHDPPRSELSKEEQVNTDNGICLCYPCHADEHDEPQSTVLLSWWEWYNSKK